MSVGDDDALDDVDDELTVETLFKRALALRQAHRWQDAVTCLDEVLQRLENVAVDQHDLRRRAMVIKIVCLDELRQLAETVLACDAFLSRYAGDRSGDNVGLVADVLWLKSRLLNRSGHREAERDVLQKLISDYVDEPLARGQVAGAMYNEGVYLRDADRGPQAVALWDQLWARFSHDPPASAPFVPIRGQLAKSTYLARTGRLDEALVTCEHMLRECRQRALPDDEVREPNAVAWRSRSATKEQRERPEVCSSVRDAAALSPRQPPGRRSRLSSRRAPSSISAHLSARPTAAFDSVRVQPRPEPEPEAVGRQPVGSLMTVGVQWAPPSVVR